MPKVSVILTTYNRAHVLADTIEAILSQTFQDFEFIISDNRSEDETREISRQYEQRDSRVRYRCNEENLGWIGSLNAAIREAKGEYIANIHDGDIYSPKLLEKWAEALDKCPDAAFVFNEYVHLDEAGNTRVVWKVPIPECGPGTILLEKVYFRRWAFNSPVWGTVMGRRKAYIDAELFQERFHAWADVDMWMRLATRYNVAYIPEPLITLPSKKVLPTHIQVSPWFAKGIVEQIFWENRMRYNRLKPLRSLLEAGRHIVFVATSRTWLWALIQRRKLIDSVALRWRNASIQ